MGKKGGCGWEVVVGGEGVKGNGGMDGGMCGQEGRCGWGVMVSLSLVGHSHTLLQGDTDPTARGPLELGAAARGPRAPADGTTEKGDPEGHEGSAARGPREPGGEASYPYIVVTAPSTPGGDATDHGPRVATVLAREA